MDMFNFFADMSVFPQQCFIASGIEVINRLFLSLGIQL